MSELKEHAIKSAKKWWNQNNCVDFADFNTARFKDFSLIRCKEIQELTKILGKKPNKAEKLIWAEEFEKEIKHRINIQKFTEIDNRIKNHAKRHAKSWLNDIEDRDFSTHTDTDFYCIAQVNLKNFISTPDSFGRYPTESDTVKWCQEFVKEIKKLIKGDNMSKITEHAKEYAINWWNNNRDFNFSDYTNTDFINFSQMRSNDKNSFRESLDRYPVEVEFVTWSNEFIKEIKKLIKTDRPKCPLCNGSLVISIYETGKYEIKCIESHCGWESTISNKPVGINILRDLDCCVLNYLETDLS